MKTLTLFVFVVSAIIANRIGQSSADPPASPAAASPAAASPHDCSGSQEDLVGVELAPAAIARGGGGGERMSIAIDVHHHFDDPAAIAGAVEVIDDRGRRIGPAGSLAVRSLPARGRTAYQIETPDRLANGYYRAQVSVLARAGGTGGVEDFSTHQLYFHVAGGSIAPITSHDWLTRSASGQAFSTPAR